MARYQPRACREDVVVQRVGAETLLYTEGSQEIHHLDAVSTAIWGACDGERDIAMMAAEVGLDRDTVAATVARMAELGLVTAPAGVGRRTVLRAAGAGVAVAAVPTIVSMLAPALAAAASGVPPSANTPSGAEQTYTADSNSTFQVTLTGGSGGGGAGGAGGPGGAGGAGATVVANITIPAGDTITYYAGGGGGAGSTSAAAAGGLADGATGGGAGATGGGGGGAASAILYQGNYILVAGGGGGGSYGLTSGFAGGNAATGASSGAAGVGTAGTGVGGGGGGGAAPGDGSPTGGGAGGASGAPTTTVITVSILSESNTATTAAGATGANGSVTFSAG